MDINKILMNSKARKSRDPRPFSAFYDLYESTENALKEVSILGASDQTKNTLLKSHLINVVTSVEVYYRDMLDSIFRMCKPDSFEDKLRKLHDASYRIDDLIQLYVNRIHPLELIAQNISFQNISNIDKIFSIIIEKPFLKEIKQQHWRLKEKPEDEYSISHFDVENMQTFFEERHVLIHNPNRNFSIGFNEVMDKINSISGVIMASDLVLVRHINDNIDDEISKK